MDAGFLQNTSVKDRNHDHSHILDHQLLLFLQVEFGPFS